MLSKTLREFNIALNKLWLDIRNSDLKENFIENESSEEHIQILEDLIKSRIFQLNAFEIMLRVAPERAIDILNTWYLSLDLSNHAKDQVSDLEIMLSDIKENLGDRKLKEIINSPSMLPKNKTNKRVKEAISFAFD